ncbi:MAG: zinc-ribbon domain-containing protein, partial [bacterium]|nr:zinc-ribbon domain-containing protein [bacterium]
MFCVNCGMQLPDGSKFCPNCGQPVLRADVSATGETPPPPELPKTPSEPLSGAGTDSGDAPTGSLEPKKPSKLIIFLGCLVGLALVIAVIFFATRPHDDEQEKVNVSEFYENADTTENEGEDSNQNETAEEAGEIAAGDAEQSGELALLPEDTKEGKLQREIMQMNSASYEEQMIDVYEIKRKAGKRDSSYVWNDTVFYTLEGYREHNDYLNKNQCTLVKKELINKESGNIMDYEIYLNPQTNVANKIVSIEYLEDGIEVTEYYYTKNKKPSFVFQYQTDNYVSSYATPDKKGQRFLFNKDCLVTWRKIDQNGTKNFCIGNNEINRLKGQWGKNTLFLYSGLNSDQKKKFDKLEKRMLNAAYNTYETVMNAEGISIIQGYVYDKNMAPLPEATIELYDESFEKQLFCASVKTDGTYRIYVPSEAYEYNIRVVKDGYGDCDIYRVVISDELIGVYQDSIYLFESGLDDKEVSIILGDALNYNESGTGMVLLSNAKVNVRKGINNRTGSQIVATGITDNSGYISLILPPGVYTLEVMADGYETMYY